MQKLSPDAKLSHYRIVSKIGAGGMGEVFLAEDTRLSRKVALKVLPDNLINNRDRLRRFEQEARASSALNHPNIITIHEIGVENNRHYIAFEFVEGKTLRERLRKEDMTFNVALDVAVQTALALEAAHEAKIVHRDIKPENIMVRTDGLVKVLDFGLAKLNEKAVTPIDTQATTQAFMLTNPGAVIGTVSYMSPEQARGQSVDARTDIWSLGVVLYEMLAKRLPFEGETTSDYLAALLNSEPAPLSRYASQIPPELERIVNKALRKDRDKRYQTIKDLLIDLQELKQDLEFAAKLERSAAPSKPANETSAAEARPTSSGIFLTQQIGKNKFGFAALLSVLLLAAFGFSYWYFGINISNSTQIDSIAVMPFLNESGNIENEYLSDGMTETLINNLSQLPKLSVKARSSVFRYKGKETDAQTVGQELSVQAILLGRVIQRGEQLTLYLELVNAQTGNRIWGEQYNRRQADLVALQSEIARDVSNKLQLKLSGADQRKLAQKLTKNYTENSEAYQLYLRGRYHTLKLSLPEVQKGVSYLQQAIKIDSSYALAYVGLADAYRSLGLAGEQLPIEYLPKAKAAAQKAIEIDDTLAEAHAVLGFTVYWYDWDWKTAEQHFKRALELNPNRADAHLAYGHFLSTAGQYEAGLAELKRARELEPLDLRISTVETTFLTSAGRDEEASARLQKIFEIDPNYWFAHMQASATYIKKGMYSEAIISARRARELNNLNSQTIALGGYALAKSGKQAEAQAALQELLQLSNERYVPPTNIAIVYAGLNEKDKAIIWFERGYEEKDPRMVFLKTDAKLDNLRSEPRFQEIMRRMNFPN